MSVLLVTDLKPGDRVVLHCPEARTVVRREVEFEHVVDGGRVRFRVLDTRVHITLKVIETGVAPLEDDAGLAVFIEQRL